MRTTLRPVSGSGRWAGFYLGWTLALLGGCGGTPEARKAQHMKRAEEYVEKRDLRRAVVEYKVAAQNVPNDPEPVYRLGMLYLSAGAGLPALEAFQRVLKLDAKHEEAGYQVSLFQAGSGKPADVQSAKKALLTYLKSHPEKAEAVGALALAEAKLGNTDEAQRLVEAAALRDPANLRPVATMIAIYSAKGEAGIAKTISERIAGKLPNSAWAAVIRAQVALSTNDLAMVDSEISRALRLERRFRPALELRLRRELMDRNTAAAEETGRELAQLPERELWAVYGRLLFAERKVEQGKAEFQRVLQEHGDDNGVRNEYALQLAEAGLAKEAEAVVEETLRKSPKDAAALLQRSGLLIERGELEGASRDLNILRGLKASPAEVAFLEARLFGVRGETMKQGEQLTEALRLQPRHRKARLELARLLAASGKAKGALQILDEADKTFQETAEFLFHRNAALLASGDWEGARKGVERGLKESPTTGFYLQNAALRLHANDTAGARASLEGALGLNPLDMQALGMLGQVMRQQGRMDQFVGRMRELAAKSPGVAGVQMLYGGALAVSGDKAGARGAYEAAKAAGEPVDADYELARLELQSGAEGAAKQRLEKLIQGRDNVKTRLLLAQLETQNNAASEVAVQHYLQAMKLEPANVMVMNNLASSLTARNKLEDAEFWGRKAAALAAGNAVVADTLGWVLYQRGKYAEALPFLEQSASALDRPVAHYHLAAVLTKMGDAGRARREYELGVKQNPAAEARQMLRAVFEQR